MAVKIRLKRMGKKKQPSYRVVVADSRSPRDGRIIESIGRYDPRQEPSLVEIDNERAQYWLGNGAQPTERAQKLLEISGAVAASKVSRPGVYRLETETAPAVEEAPTPVEVDPVSEVAPEAMSSEETPTEEAPTEQAPSSEETVAPVEAAGESDAAAEAAEESPADEGEDA